MAYTPNDNPYIPGDPYSYDLKWIVEKLKEAIALYEPLNHKFDSLKEYVEDYFASLDLTAEVQEAVDSLKDQGFFDQLIYAIAITDGNLQDAVTDWLADNVTPVGSAVVVDSSLTVSGAAADAKVVGDTAFFLRSRLTQNTDLDSYTTPGIYWFNAADIVTIANSPLTIANSGTLFVMPSSTGSPIKLQLLTTISGDTYSRYCTASVVWRPWIRLDVPDEVFAVRGSISSGTDLDTLTKYGAYRFSAANIAQCINLPPNFISDSGWIYIYPAGSSNSIIVQEIRTLEGFTSMRYRTSDLTWRDWNRYDLNWLAFGDSITYGVYSTGPGVTAVTNRPYNKIYALRHDLTITTYGIRGMGYVAVGSNQIDLDSALQDLPDGSFDIVSIALGINDYNTSGVAIGTINDDVSDNTIIGHCKKAIQAISAKYPNATIWIFSTLNSNVHGGDIDSSYDLNTSYSGRTLEQVNAAIKAVADLYNLPYLDMLHGSPVNNLNITTALPDGVHPSLSMHTRLAYHISRNFVN